MLERIDYQEAGNRFDWLEVRMKLVVSLLMILSNTLLPDGAWLGFALSWSLVLIICLATKTSVVFLLKRSLVILPFLLTACTLIITVPGRILFTFQIGRISFSVTQAGVERFLSVFIRGWISIQVAVLLIATTKFSALNHALVSLKIPSIFVGTIAFMYRYLHLTKAEALRMVRAKASRSGRNSHDGKCGLSFSSRIQIIGSMMGKLFLRSFERSERVYNAMLARGFNGKLLILDPPRIRFSDWILGSFVLFGLVIVQIVARVF